MTKKRQSIGSLGTIIAVFLILIASYLSSVVYEAPQLAIPRIDTTGRSVTGLATTFTATCADASTILKVSGNSNALSADYDSTTYTKRICADASLGTGHTCIYPTVAPTTTTTSTLPAYCSNTAWDGDESDQLSANQGCGGSCTKCSAGYYCWANSDCSSNNCYFDAITMQKRTAAGILPDQRLTPISTNIQYQGVCTSSSAQQTTTTTTTSTSEGSSGVSVGTSLTAGAIADVTGEQFTLPYGTVVLCTDGIKSGDESDVDCGGTCFNKCANAKTCNINVDCISNFCDIGICVKTTTTPTIPSITTIPSTTTTPATGTPTNVIIRIGSDNTVEQFGYTGTSATTTTATQVTYKGAVTTCSIKRTDQQIRSDFKCAPTTGPTGTKLLGIIDEYNDGKKWYNGYAVYVSNTIDGEVVKNNDCRSPDCSLPACTKGTLQTEILEYDQDYGTEALTYRKYGICATKNIKKATCSQLYSQGGRTCTTTAPEQGMTKIEGYIIDIVNTKTLTRHFHYHDLYIQSQDTVQQPTPVTYTDVCFGDGPYHYEDRTGKTKGACDAGECIFTISAATGARVADCSTANAYSTSVCSGGYCVGTDCNQPGCQSENSCNANPSCAWDTFEKKVAQCKNRGGVCNQFGVTLCNPASFRAGDYSCLYKDPQTNYYTKSCEGTGQFGFWQIPEVY